MSEALAISPDMTLAELTASLQGGGEVSVKTDSGEFVIAVEGKLVGMLVESDRQETPADI